MKQFIVSLLLLGAMLGSARAQIYTLEAGGQERLVEREETTGAVQREILIQPRLYGNVNLAVDGETAYITTQSSIRRIDLDSGTELPEIVTPCCLTGEMSLADALVYVMVDEEGSLLWVGFDTHSGAFVREIVLPNDVLAVAVAPRVAPMSNGGGCMVHKGGTSWGVSGMLLILAPLVCMLIQRQRKQSTCILVLLLLGIVAPASATYPRETWAGTTIGYDEGPAQLLLFPLEPATGASRHYPSGATGASVGQAAAPCEYEGEGTGAGPCILEPVPPYPSGGGTWKTIDLGIIVPRTWQDYQMPYYGCTGCLTTVDQAFLLTHLRETINTVVATYRRDLHLNIRVTHVWVQVALGESDPYDYWQRKNVGHTNALITLRANPGGGGSGHAISPTCAMGGAWAGYDLLGDPQSHNWRWRANVYGISHELGHVVGIAHSDFYTMDGIHPVEQCPAQCYTGAVVCPSAASESFMGYCKLYCGLPNVGSLRLHDPYGPLIRVARSKVQSNACLSVAEQEGDPNGFIDMDNDEFPDDGLDNCSMRRNIGQEDKNLDGIGNACGCQINPQSKGSFVQSLLMLLPLVVGGSAKRRVKRCLGQ